MQTVTVGPSYVQSTLGESARVEVQDVQTFSDERQTTSPSPIKRIRRTATSAAIAQFFDESSPLKRQDFANPYLKLTTTAMP